MSDNYDFGIAEEFSDGRLMPSRKGLAGAITNDGDIEKEVHELEDNTYHVEVFEWEENSESHKVTAVHENGEEAYVLTETNSLGAYDADVFVSPDSEYANAINSKTEFDEFMEDLEGSDEIEMAAELEQEYAVDGGYGRN